MKEKRHETDVLFTMVTFLIYALALLLFVSLGATVYRSVTQRMEQHQNQRTAESYLREKMRQNDREGAVCVTDIEGQNALQITETVGEKEYRTYIYTDGGMLKELLISSEREAHLSEGTPLVAVKNIEFQEDEEGILTVSMESDQGKVHTFQIRRKCDGV